MKWTQYVQLSDFGKYYLITNQINNSCFKISHECLNYIQEAIAEGRERADFVDWFDLEEDQEYIRSLTDRLYDLLMLADEDIRLDHRSFNIVWYLTYRCNLLCRHCSVSANNIINTDLRHAELMAIARKLADLNPRMLTLSGGEPMMSESFFDVVSEIRKTYQGNLTLMSNATLINEENAEFIARHFHSVNISLDGYNEETCAKIRGIGVFDKVMKSIQLLQSAGNDQIILSMVQTRENLKFRDEFIELCEMLKVRRMFRYFENIGRGKDNEEEFMDPEAFVKQEIAYSNKLKSKTPPRVFSCKAAISEFLIDDQGWLFPCVMLTEREFRMGNVYEIDDLKLFLENGHYKDSEGHQNLLKLMPYNLEHCRQCRFNMICGNCVGEIKSNIDNNVFTIKCASQKNSLRMFID